jgi:hypothetical protein
MAITNGYATLAEIKAALRISDSVDDALLEPAVESASRLIDGHCQRIFYSAGTATRVFTPNQDYLVQIDDLQSLTSLKTSSDGDGIFDVTWSATDYQLEPLNGLVAGQASPFTRIRAIDNETFPVGWQAATVQVVGVWGMATTPAVIKQATIIQASRIFKRLDTPLGITFGELGAMRVGMTLDPDVAHLVNPYVRYVGGVA